MSLFALVEWLEKRLLCPALRKTEYNLDLLSHTLSTKHTISTWHGCFLVREWAVHLLLYFKKTFHTFFSKLT